MFEMEQRVAEMRRLERERLERERLERELQIVDYEEYEESKQ